ncbi:MAG: hypothetical protein QOG76_3150, partial [Pseudonocardiales bacterium]|nr:hypothetical protein [Pseudonocardiales bacterium]
VGPTRAHGQDGTETMTVIRVGPQPELTIFVSQPRRPSGCLAAPASARASLR